MIWVVSATLALATGTAAKEGQGRSSRGRGRGFRLAAAARGGRFFRRRRWRHSKQSWSPPLSGYLELEPSHTSSLLSFSSSGEEDTDGSEEFDKVGITSRNILGVVVDSDPSEATPADAGLVFADFSLMENNLEIISEEPAVVLATAWSDLSQDLSSWTDEPPNEYLQLIITYSGEGQELQYTELGEGESCPTVSVSVAAFEVVGDLDESLSSKSEQQEDMLMCHFLNRNQDLQQF